MAVQTATATANDGATTGAVFAGYSLLSIQGMPSAGSALILFQRSHDSGTTWHTIKTFNRDAEKNFYAPGSATYYRLIAKNVKGTPSIVLRLEDNN